ncbi:STAS-like domain-containing protein [Empedobacter brevis]|uniref:STAS-like domain-containing protein n=1 Tax=Empedobacter brevis TaxID=247 RepID=UPI0023F518CD|nr:STAS-like domain-containing protein [Empedobacter brevis]
MDDIKISILDFSEYPGPRYKIQGNNSGEQFYEEFIKPNFDKAIKNDKKLIVDLDGAAGFASSFLDEAFGRLTKKYSLEVIYNTLEIISEEETSWIDVIFKEILPQWNSEKD